MPADNTSSRQVNSSQLPVKQWASHYRSERMLTYTHTFNGPLSGTTQVNQYQKGKTYLDFTEVRDSEWQWHQLGQMQVCTSLQTDNHTSTPLLSLFTGRMPFLPPNQQRQSTKGSLSTANLLILSHILHIMLTAVAWPHTVSNTAMQLHKHP